MDPSKKKAIFAGYIDQSKSYRVYIPGYRQIKISRDVIFDEDVAFNKTRNNYVDKYQEEEHDAHRVEETSKIPVRNVEEEKLPEYHDMTKPKRNLETP